MCAVYLIEYAARGNKLAKSIGLLVDVMSGIPSIVAGLFAYSMFSLIGAPAPSAASKAPSRFRC